VAQLVRAMHLVLHSLAPLTQVYLVQMVVTHLKAIKRLAAPGEQSLVLAGHHQLVNLRQFIRKAELTGLGIQIQTLKDPKHMGRVVQQITTTQLQKLQATHWVGTARKVLSSLNTQTHLQSHFHQMQLAQSSARQFLVTQSHKVAVL
jgi:hypothetical protein